jgi:hypothetical protein
MLMLLPKDHAKKTVQNCQKVTLLAEVKQMRAIPAIFAYGWDPATLRMGQLNNQDVGPFLEETKSGQRPE